MTHWVRVKLYREGLSQLQPQQTLYFDTDSLVYRWKPNQPKLPLGDFLGEFTDKMREGDHIVEFASARPRNFVTVLLVEKSNVKYVASPSTPMAYKS